jgi:dethiobiotin synthetase
VTRTRDRTQGLFVTATDTGAGKTVVAASIIAALAARGVDVSARKPILTGTGETADGLWPPDDVLLAGAAGCRPEEVALACFAPAVSPHLATELVGVTLDCEALVARTLADARDGEVRIVEGIGGLLVPLADGWDVGRFAAELGLPVLVAARPGLGTLNHALLTLEAARRRELSVAAVVLTPWPSAPSKLERSNMETIARLGAVEVVGLAPIARPEPSLLAAAGRQLPIDEWLALPEGTVPSPVGDRAAPSRYGH